MLAHGGRTVHYVPMNDIERLERRIAELETLLTSLVPKFEKSDRVVLVAEIVDIDEKGVFLLQGSSSPFWATLADIRGRA